jgi:hypothetical protein
MLVGRLIGTVVSGSTSSVNFLYIILETLDSALLFLALRIKDKPA